MIIAWIVGYLLLFIFLLYQEWRLIRQISSPAWSWEVAAFTLVFVSLIARLLLAWLLPEYTNIRLILSLVTAPLGLIFLIISKHCLHRDLQALDKMLDKSLQSKQEEDDYVRRDRQSE